MDLVIDREMPELAPELEARVATLWDQARQDKPLFNGRVFCADEIGPGQIAGHWTEYRRIMAQMRDPTLIPHLRIRSLAVCGVLEGPDGVAIGRRDPASAYQPGLWQCPPAGSVDHGAATPGGADWRRALLAELQEELGLQPETAEILRPLCLVHHPSGVLDMGVHIRTSLTRDAILHAHRSGGDGEYDRLLVVPRAGLMQAISAQAGTPVPSVAAFLDALTLKH